MCRGDCERYKFKHKEKKYRKYKKPGNTNYVIIKLKSNFSYSVLRSIKKIHSDANSTALIILTKCIPVNKYKLNESILISQVNGFILQGKF